jgi:putative transposase
VTEHLSQLASSTEVQREQALERFSLIQPFLEGDIPLTHVAAMQRLPLRTLRQWVQRYRQKGLVGLMRKGRSDRGKRRGLPADLVRLIEELALHHPKRSVAALHRQVITIAMDHGWPQPSYGRVYAIVRSLDPAWGTAANAGPMVQRTR